MTRARDIADLVDANGDIVAGALDNVPAADLVNDTTPQLGGNLDAQENIIASASRLQVGRQSITQAYTAASNGYVADFQGHSSSGQTYISIAAPNVASLGSGGMIIGEDLTDAYVLQRANKNLKLATSDLNRVVIDGAGRVTLPYQPYFQFEHATNGGITIPVNSYINHTQQIHNVGNHVNSSGTFTAPVAGVYGLYWKMISNSTNIGNIHTSFIFSAGSHGGTNYHYSFGSQGGWRLLTMGGYYYMPQGCTVRVYNHSVAWSGHGGSWSQFSGYLVG